jgi:hypothetical protein
VSLPRDREAEAEYARLTAGFATELDEATESAHRAFRRRITTEDFRRARDTILARRAPRSLLREFLLLGSGALLGTGVQGLFTEFSGERARRGC